jgi:replication fork clamp-binding protein CrfC
VLGSQSAGKSSVLESIVGLDFLPRGDGVVTRRPLELRLNHMDANVKPYAVFPDEIPGRKFTNFNEVRDNINGLTDKKCGADKNILDDPIVLQVYSHTCPDLTLIDLPGITRIAVGDQPKDIERITRNMAARYVGDLRTIILCVVPANADMTNSDGLQMARQLDPKGVRTVGVITKIDIMDRGTNAKKMIMN